MARFSLSPGYSEWPGGGKNLQKTLNVENIWMCMMLCSSAVNDEVPQSSECRECGGTTCQGELEQIWMEKKKNLKAL